MNSTGQLRLWWPDHKCNPSRMVTVAFPGEGRVWNLKVADQTAEAWRAFADVMAATGYLFRETAGGTYNCRPIGNTTSYSLHAYGLALDLNPSKNRQGTKTHDFPAPFTEAIEGITAGGQRVFRWGIVFDNPDPMHWEINLSPASLALGIDKGGEDEMEFIISVLKGQNMAFYRSLAAKTGVPGGDAGYWGYDYVGQKPSEAEWLDAAGVLFGAALQASVFTEGGAPGTPGATPAQVADEIARRIANG